MWSRLSIAAAILFTSTPAAAHGAAQEPEASVLTLLGLGMAGVLIGRRLSIGDKDRD